MKPSSPPFPRSTSRVMRRAIPIAAAALVLTLSTIGRAGPETAMREFASGQVKKGVRTIGMGGDGATTGNYALVYKDAGAALFDYGAVRFSDTGTRMTFTAVGLTTPTFWNDAAFYIIAIAQHATDLHVWDLTPPSAKKPPSLGDGSNQAVFVKFAKPLTDTLSIGLLGSYELSQMTLLPNSGAAPIRYETFWRPSGGAGLHFHPDDRFQAGVRVILNHDMESRADSTGVHRGLARSYEYRLGVAYSPWKGGLFDVGATALDRSNGLEGTSTFEIHPNLGAEQAIVPKTFWLRVGLDETTPTAGASVRVGLFKFDLAVFKNLAAARTNDTFGHDNVSAIGTVNFDYEKLVAHGG